MGHIHIGLDNEIRLAIEKEMAPLAFLLFIIRQRYPVNWMHLIQSPLATQLEGFVRTSLAQISPAYKKYETNTKSGWREELELSKRRYRLIRQACNQFASYGLPDLATLKHKCGSLRARVAALGMTPFYCTQDIWGHTLSLYNPRLLSPSV